MTIDKLFTFLTILYFNIVFLVTLYFDIKYRKVPNKFFKVAYSFNFTLNIIEYLGYINYLFIFIFGKIFFF